MSDLCDPMCPFLGCASCAYSGGGIPAAATESTPVSGGASGMIRGLAHTRETPASIGVDRGRGPTVEESNKMDATPKLTPAAGA